MTEMKKTARLEYYLAGAVSALTFLVYLPALRNGLVNWDDNTYVIDNPHIRSLGLPFLKWAFSSFYAANWHPLTWISHALDYAVWGTNLLGHHLTNIIIHSINTFVVVLLAARLIGVWEEGRAGLPPAITSRAKLIAAGTAGLLFGIHPLHVETVAWLAERKDVLCALFFLLSLLAYIKYADGLRKTDSRRGLAPNKAYLLSLGLFVLALMSKPMAVSLPLVLLILDWHPFGRIRFSKSSWKVLGEKLPFILLSGASCAITVLAQKAGGAMDVTGPIPLPVRLIVAVRALAAYLLKMLLPIGLVPYYPYPHGVSLMAPEYMLAAVFVITATALCLRAAKKRRLWLAAWGYYVVTLLPVIGIVQVGGQSMADRYTYLPSLGPFLLAGLAAAWVWQRAEDREIAFKAVAAAAALLAVFSLSYLTVRQIRIWNNNSVFWDYVNRKGGILAGYNKGDVSFPGLTADEATIAVLSRRITEYPSDFRAYLVRGNIYKGMGRPDLAMADYDSAIAINPCLSEAYNNRGFIFTERGQPGLAMADYGRAIAINPYNAEAYYNRGNLFAYMAQTGQAIADYGKAIALNPSFQEAYANRGIELMGDSRFISAALNDLNEAVVLNPADTLALVSRGEIYSRMGDGKRASSDFRKACALGDQNGCRRLTGIGDQ